jgi:hypothetical protein
MRLRSQAVVGLLGLLVVVGCGRADGDSDVSSGGSAGKLGAGGQLAAGGSGGAGSGGTIGVGGSGVGGAPGQGGAIATGGIPGEGGAAGGSIGSAGDGGIAGQGGTSSDLVPLGEGSWDTSLALTVEKSLSLFAVTCKNSQFTLHLSPSGSSLQVISGRDGAVLTGELTRAGAGEPTYTVSKSLPLPARGQCELYTLSVSELALYGTDQDGDGRADRIAGVGKAIGSAIQGDVVVSAELTFTLSGVPDATKPSFLVPEIVHPLDGVSVRATEPVTLTSSVSLTSSGSPNQPLSGLTATDGALGSFSSPVNLPFGSSWKLSAEGSDLANLPFDIAALPVIGVLADPGLFAQDGFETTPAVQLTSEAKIVTSIGTLPAISGSKSLLVPVNSSATLHLARPSGANSVRFTAQGLSNTSDAVGSSSYMKVGVIGGVKRPEPAAPLPMTSPALTNDATWMYAGPKQEVSLTLTESGADIAIRFALPECFGLCPPAQALLIDDLRVE